MKRILTIVCSSVLLTGLVLGLGCSKRENPLITVSSTSRQPFVSTVPFASLRYNPLGDGATRIVSVAYASSDSLSEPQAPMPVLYLLHDFEGDGKYFGRFDLQGILDEMYSEGEIGRMMVVTVGSNNAFGGSYYRNSVSTGAYADMLGEAIHYIERNYPAYTAGGKRARAISGHGMGGYGAVRYAMEHAEMFGATSSMSGPLSFTAMWDGTPWLSRWIDQMFAENGVTAGDSAGYAAMAPNDPAKLFTNRMFAMASAFSPRELDPFEQVLPTCKVCNSIIGCPPGPLLTCQGGPCSVFVAMPAGLSTFKFPPNPNGGRTPCASPQNPLENGVDLPFFWTKAVYDSIWNLWAEADVTSYLENNPDVFADMDVYVDCGVEDEYGYLYHSRDFVSALKTASYQEGTDFEYDEYHGSPGIRAGHDELMVERLRKILKFHSDRFSRPPGSN